MTNTARRATSVEDVDDNTALMIDHSVALSRLKMYRWALPLVTMSWLMLAAILIGSIVRISRWELAPGEALPVASRISFAEAHQGSGVPPRYKTTNSIRFVTAFAGQITALDSVIGWIDPDVQVDTYVERFGPSDPGVERKIGFQAMYGAKQLAEYVALKKLKIGEPAFAEGIVVVQQVVCAAKPATRSACKVLEVGDTITAVEGTPTPTLTDLAAAITDRPVGSRITVTVTPYEKKTTRDVVVQMMEDPETPGRAIIGFIPADTRRVLLPFDVKIATTDIGGPSAGLAFTLALIDELSPGNLMGSVRVAATGTINENGEVGAIGALRQKAVAVRDAGAQVFLVPSGQSPAEIAAARQVVGNKVEIITVATIDEALKALERLGGTPLPATQTTANK